jgi:hypothetical protein
VFWPIRACRKNKEKTPQEEASVETLRESDRGADRQ